MSDSTLKFHGEACSVVFDTRWLPVAFATWVGTPDSGLVDDYFAAQVELSRRLQTSDQRMVMISDCRAMGRPTPLVRKRIADHAEHQRELLEATMIGSCTIFSSALVRGVLTALSWLDPKLGVPSFANLDGALAWASEVLAANDLDVPSIDLDEVAAIGGTPRA